MTILKKKILYGFIGTLFYLFFLGEKMKKVALATIIYFVCYTNAFAGYYKHLAVNLYSQDDPCWCSITTLEMWADWQHGWNWKKGRQTSLAKKYKVGSYNKTKKECPTSGLNVNQLADALENEAVSWNFSAYSTKSSDFFATKIAKEIQSGQPVAIVCYTRYKDGRKKANQHYMIADAFENTTAKYSSSSSNIKGFYVNDPAYGASNLSYVYSVSPRTFISKSSLTKYYASKYKDKFYLVED